MTMPAPLASVHARFAASTGREVRVATDAGALGAADDGSAAPPRSLLLGALAACTALAARTHLERGGDPGDVEVVVTMEAGPEPVLYRRVLLGVRLPADDVWALERALDRTDVTALLRPAFRIRTQVESPGTNGTFVR